MINTNFWLIWPTYFPEYHPYRINCDVCPTENDAVKLYAKLSDLPKGTSLNVRLCAMTVVASSIVVIE